MPVLNENFDINVIFYMDIQTGPRSILFSDLDLTVSKIWNFCQHFVCMYVKFFGAPILVDLLKVWYTIESIIFYQIDSSSSIVIGKVYK